MPPPQTPEKKYFSGKHHVIFGQLIYFRKKEEQAPLFFDSTLFLRRPSVLDYPGQSLISGSCPAFHSVLDLSWI